MIYNLTKTALLCILFIPFAIFSQVFEHGEGLINDSGTNSSASNGFAVDDAGNTYMSMMVGTSFSIFYPNGVSSASGKVKIAKHDPSGNLIWQIAGGQLASIRDMIIDDYGNIYISGYQTYGLITSANCPGYINFTDFIAKMNPDGTFAWMTKMPGVAQIAATENGKIAFAVTNDPTNGGQPYVGDSAISSNPIGGIIYGEVASTGIVDWFNVTPAGGASNASVRGASYKNGKFYFYGYFKGTYDFGNGVNYYLDNTCGGSIFIPLDMYLAKVDVNFQYVENVAETSRLQIQDMEFDDNGNVLFAMQHNGVSTSCNDPGEFMGVSFPYAPFDSYIFKTDPNYNVIVTHDIAGPTAPGQKAYVNDIEIVGSNTYVAFQNYDASSGVFQVTPTSQNTASDPSFHIMRLDDSLQYKFHTTIPVSNFNNDPRDILIDASNEQLATFMHTSSPFTSSTFTHYWFVGAYKTNANELNGIMFRDFDYNGQFNSGDLPYAGSLEIQPNALQVVTQPDGSFTAYVDQGTYVFECPNLPANYSNETPNVSHTFNGNSQSATVNVPIIPTPNVNDIELEITTPHLLVLEDTTEHTIRITNVGTTIQDVNISVTPLDLTFGTNDIDYSNFFTLNNGILEGTISGMLPGEVQEYTISYVPNILMLQYLGDLGISHASASTANTDITPGNNNASISQELRAAYDPNIKVVQEPHLLNFDSLYHYDYINYTIHFQNEGNYPAANIRITDTIQEKLILPSIRILDASHNFEATVEQDSIVHFSFDNIMLVPKSQDEYESRGYITFQLLRTPSLNIGDTIANFADIYFDGNPPIRTNEAHNVVVFIDVTSLLETNTEPVFVCYPNPTSNGVQLKNIPVGTKEIFVSDLTGRILKKLTVFNNNDGVYLQMDDLPSGNYILTVGDKTAKVQLLK